MNGQYIYLSATENAVWFKKRGAIFNAHCKHNVFEFPTGRSKIHPIPNFSIVDSLIPSFRNTGEWYGDRKRRIDLSYRLPK